VNRFTVQFWGVRGSLATCGLDFAEVGGNTSCVEVRVGEEVIILDAGTGLRPLGQTLGHPTRATFFLTHYHWDHIQGFPFFRPAYLPENSFTLYGPGKNGDGLEAALRRQMQAPHFPVTLAALQARLDFRSIRAGDAVCVGAARVRAAALNHPQGCLGYRISYGGVSVAYATDTEHVAVGVGDPGTLELARGADVLIYDAQYTDDEYHGRSGPPHQGWGHSTVEEACRLARAAGVRQLVLFHHDPTHDDRFVDELIASARVLFPNVVAAREGLTMDLLQLKDVPHAGTPRTPRWLQAMRPAGRAASPTESRENRRYQARG
jgi:phosphoribosyl 1,2-cyclic phosphodiesterase